MELRLIPSIDGQCRIGRAGADALRPQVHLAHPAGRLRISFPFIHAEHPDAVIGRLDGISSDERQHDVCRGGVAVRITVAAQLGSLAFFDHQLFQPASGRRVAQTPLQLPTLCALLSRWPRLSRNGCAFDARSFVSSLHTSRPLPLGGRRCSKARLLRRTAPLALSRLTKFIKRENGTRRLKPAIFFGINPDQLVLAVVVSIPNAHHEGSAPCSDVRSRCLAFGRVFMAGEIRAVNPRASLSRRVSSRRN